MRRNWKVMTVGILGLGLAITLSGCVSELTQPPTVAVTNTEKEPETTEEPTTTGEPEEIIITEASTGGIKFLKALMARDWVTFREYSNIPDNAIINESDYEWLFEEGGLTHLKILLDATGNIEPLGETKVDSKTVYAEFDTSVGVIGLELVKTASKTYGVKLDEKLFTSEITVTAPRDVKLSVNGTLIDVDNWKKGKVGGDSVECITNTVVLLDGREYTLAYSTIFGQFFKVINGSNIKNLELCYVRDSGIEDACTKYIGETWLEMVQLYQRKVAENSGNTNSKVKVDDFRRFFSQDVPDSTISSMLNELKSLTDHKTNFKLESCTVAKENANAGVLAMTDSDTLCVKFQLNFSYTAMKDVETEGEVDGKTTKVVNQIEDGTYMYYRVSSLYLKKLGDGWYVIDGMPDTSVFGY